MYRSLSLLICTSLLAAADFPQAELSNGQIVVKIDLPDAHTGYYRGTRFDWSGMIQSVVYNGHEYYGPWFQRVDSAVHDFAYQGADVVASPCTAAVGPAEEFVTADTLPLGYAEAAPGGTFVKIGVGALRKPDNSPYDRFHLYDIVSGSQWSVRRAKDSIEFTERLNAAGFGYLYQKTVSVTPGKPQLRIAHRLRNTGTKPIETNVYNHNFLRIDGDAPGPDYQLTFPFTLKPSTTLDQQLAEIRGNRLVYLKSLTGEQRVATPIEGFGPDARDYEIRIENTKSGAGLTITGDRPLATESLWSIRAVLAVEPFVRISIAPGQQFTWSMTYTYYTPGK
jgi:hypothetical protein